MSIAFDQQTSSEHLRVDAYLLGYCNAAIRQANSNAHLYDRTRQHILDIVLHSHSRLKINSTQLK